MRKGFSLFDIIVVAGIVVVIGIAPVLLLELPLGVYLEIGGERNKSSLDTIRQIKESISIL
jgi:hypothetical protein